MLWKDLEIHNAEHVSRRDDGVLQIYRFPKNVMDVFGSDGLTYPMNVGRMTTGCELRFVCEAADIILSAEDCDGSVDVYRGDFKCQTIALPAGKMTRIELRKSPEFDRYDLHAIPTNYSTDLWRIIINHDSRCVLHHVDAIRPMRPPVSGEVPAKKLLAYGTSITHGAGADRIFQNSYIATVGKLLGIDILCKGMGGSCFCEKEVADYIADADWDIALLELSVNMISRFSLEEFSRRVRYLIAKVLSAKKPVVVVSHFTSYCDLPESTHFEKNEAFIQAVESTCSELACENLHYIKGREILTDYKYLLADLIHPTSFGHFEMGHKIAEKLKSIL